jgi:hypothetical protein
MSFHAPSCKCVDSTVSTMIIVVSTMHDYSGLILGTPYSTPKVVQDGHVAMILPHTSWPFKIHRPERLITKSPFLNPKRTTTSSFLQIFLAAKSGKHVQSMKNTSNFSKRDIAPHVANTWSRSMVRGRRISSNQRMGK